MEVLTTATGRPRFIPTEPVVMSSSATVAATATMTRSPISHHNHHHHQHHHHHHQIQQQQQQQICNNNGQSSPPSVADTTIRDKTRLLQLAEKVHTRKSASPNYTKSFRAITSAVTKGGNSNNRDEAGTPTVRRTNSTMLSSSTSAPPNAAVSRSKVENYKNPKLYASFSSKSSSKLTKALIKSDPAKTNIEHLVKYKNVNNSSPKGSIETQQHVPNSAISGTVNGKKSSENGEHNQHHHHHNTHHINGSSGGGLSSFITPLKALHASFHERSSKLGQTRSKLFSQHHQNKEVSASNAKLLFGTTENLHSSCSSGSSSEDILATEIIASKRTNNSHHNKSSSAQEQKHQQKQRRTTTTVFGNSNNKHVVPTTPAAAPLSSTAAIRGQLQQQNGSNSSATVVVTTAAAAAVTVPPDFLDGFRNENACRSNHVNNNNNSSNRDNNGHHVTNHHREINGSDRISEAHEQEISSTNTTNSFITPDILGGCLDVPKGTSKPASLISSRNGITSRQSICENDQNYLPDELRQANERNYNTVGHTNGTETAPNKYNSPLAQQHLSNKDNKDMLQKRKNIVVRMSYHHNDDDETSYNDLYRICNSGGDGSNNENGVAGDDDQVDIWPKSPITVSTVTPKSKQCAAAATATATTSRSDNAAQVIITATTNNYCGKEDSSYNVATSPNAANADNNRQDSQLLSDSPYAAFNLTNPFHPNNYNESLHNNNNQAGGSVSHHQQQQQQQQQHVAQQQSHHNNRTASSTVSNSGMLFKSAEDRQINLQQQQRLLQQQQQQRRGQQIVARSSSLLLLQPQDKEEHLQQQYQTTTQTLQSHSPEATGSSTWLQTKNPSTPGGVNSFNNNTNAKEIVVNGSNSKPALYLHGKDFKKQALKKATTLSDGGGKYNNGNSNTSYLLNGSGVVDSRRCNDDDNNSINEKDAEERVEFAAAGREKGLSTTKPDEDNEEGRGRSRRGMFMEAETSFSPHQKISRGGVGGGRPQTALLSDEYARYLGYDYDNGKTEVQQQQQQQQEALQSRLHVHGNKSSEMSAAASASCSKEKCENDSGVFGGGGDDERNMTMLAITTTATSDQARYRDRVGGKMNVTSIMKGKRQEAKPIMHSVSFRGTIDSTERDRENYRKCLNGIAEHPKIDRCESFSNFDRKRSRSLPKSFMSVRNGLRNVLPSQWVRDGQEFERLNDDENPSPVKETIEEQDSCSAIIDEQEEDTSEALKMRWNKLGSSSSTSASFSDRRPKSFDYAQRKAWMKLYRDMEVSQASGSSSPAASRISRPISKGSITHLHLQEASSTDHITGCSSNSHGADETCRCEYESDGASMSTMMRSSADISETSPSLFKRFSKTFSLRFGSGSNVSKHSGDVHRKAKSKGAIGSSPDLFNRLDVDGSRDKVNGKMRKTNVKSVRGDKCQSGDSGIGMEEQQTEARQVSNLRRIRSDYISSSTIGVSPAVPSYASRQHANTSALAKLSLVEIPDHSWDENNGSPNEGSGTSDTASYEDLVDAKLDQDDGFSSSDEGHHIENPTYYHTLPHRKHNKRRLKETESANSCGGDVPQEDNSIRGKVVREIIHTEQNYVKTLNDIVQGFLNPCRARNDLFSSRTVQNIFSNIEEILRLHVKFLEALKSKVDPTYVSKSSVGGVFTSWADKFSLYSEYCCNNPISVATVRSLVQFPQYAEFFEACRRLQMMDKLPLHGFLLRPIQRICQYHLQLNELLKHTEESHTDHRSVVEALETMKSVATRINDTQRQFESLQEIIRFQNSIDGWEGPNLVDRNTVILRKGELVKVTHGRKHKEVFVAILNKDLIYCKKDFMKKSGYVFDGRIDLNLRMWINIDSNEEDEFFGMVHNSWRIYSPERRAWILFTAPSPTEKRKWISALEKTKESIVLDPKLREMAVVTTALADTEMMYGGGSQGHHSNTLPKSSKKSKGKHLSVTKVDSDAMLIEVGKLKRSTIINPVSNPSHKEGTSKFYV